jgi:FixJ family two-component response regulator
MTVDRASIAIIDSDESLRARLGILLGAAGLNIELFNRLKNILREVSLIHPIASC